MFIMCIKKYHFFPNFLMASDTIVCQIQETTEANTKTKQLRIQAQIVSKELRSRDGRAQCEHELKQQMLMQEHERSMANEKVRLLELVLNINYCCGLFTDYISTRAHYSRVHST